MTWLASREKGGWPVTPILSHRKEILMATPTNRPRQHLRDAATICPNVSGWGRLAIRCERNAGHDGKHKNGCAHWGQSTADAAAGS